ncbi:unnamed protein product [Closterium sp. Naga37s-1]|nr:unnamed protein product [Closterium sp. Naga37s-1]
MREGGRLAEELGHGEGSDEAGRQADRRVVDMVDSVRERRRVGGDVCDDDWREEAQMLEEKLGGAGGREEIGMREQAMGMEGVGVKRLREVATRNALCLDAVGGIGKRGMRVKRRAWRFVLDSEEQEDQRQGEEDEEEEEEEERDEEEEEEKWEAGMEEVVVCNRFEGPKYDLAVRSNAALHAMRCHADSNQCDCDSNEVVAWRHRGDSEGAVWVVNHRWLEDCLLYSRRVPEAPYALLPGDAVGPPCLFPSPTAPPLPPAPPLSSAHPVPPALSHDLLLHALPSVASPPPPPAPSQPAHTPPRVTLPVTVAPPSPHHPSTIPRPPPPPPLPPEEPSVLPLVAPAALPLMDDCKAGAAEEGLWNEAGIMQGEDKPLLMVQAEPGVLASRENVLEDVGSGWGGGAGSSGLRENSGSVAGFANDRGKDPVGRGEGAGKARRFTKSSPFKRRRVQGKENVPDGCSEGHGGGKGGVVTRIETSALADEASRSPTQTSSPSKCLYDRVGEDGIWPSIHLGSPVPLSLLPSQPAPGGFQVDPDCSQVAPVCSQVALDSSQVKTAEEIKGGREERREGMDAQGRGPEGKETREPDYGGREPEGRERRATDAGSVEEEEEDFTDRISLSPDIGGGSRHKPLDCRHRHLAQQLLPENSPEGVPESSPEHLPDEAARLNSSQPGECSAPEDGYREIEPVGTGGEQRELPAVAGAENWGGEAYMEEDDSSFQQAPSLLASLWRPREEGEDRGVLVDGPREQQEVACELAEMAWRREGAGGGLLVGRQRGGGKLRDVRQVEEDVVREGVRGERVTEEGVREEDEYVIQGDVRLGHVGQEKVEGVRNEEVAQTGEGRGAGGRGRVGVVLQQERLDSGDVIVLSDSDSGRDSDSEKDSDSCGLQMGKRSKRGGEGSGRRVRGLWEDEGECKEREVGAEEKEEEEEEEKEEEEEEEDEIEFTQRLPENMGRDGMAASEPARGRTGGADGVRDSHVHGSQGPHVRACEGGVGRSTWHGRPSVEKADFGGREGGRECEGQMGQEGGIEETVGRGGDEGERGGERGGEQRLKRLRKATWRRDLLQRRTAAAAETGGHGGDGGNGRRSGRGNGGGYVRWNAVGGGDEAEDEEEDAEGCAVGGVHSGDVPQEPISPSHAATAGMLADDEAPPGSPARGEGTNGGLTRGKGVWTLEAFLGRKVEPRRPLKIAEVGVGEVREAEGRIPELSLLREGSRGVSQQQQQQQQQQHEHLQQQQMRMREVPSLVPGQADAAAGVAGGVAAGVAGVSAAVGGSETSGSRATIHRYFPPSSTRPSVPASSSRQASRLSPVRGQQRSSRSPRSKQNQQQLLRPSQQSNHPRSHQSSHPRSHLSPGRITIRASCSGDPFRLATASHAAPPAAHRLTAIPAAPSSVPAATATAAGPVPTRTTHAPAPSRPLPPLASCELQGSAHTPPRAVPDTNQKAPPRTPPGAVLDGSRNQKSSFRTPTKAVFDGNQKAVVARTPPRAAFASPSGGCACAICQEDTPASQIGVLPCMHAFCYSCIRKWAESAATAIPGCPLCKEPFEFITVRNKTASRRAAEAAKRTSLPDAAAAAAAPVDEEGDIQGDGEDERIVMVPIRKRRAPTDESPLDSGTMEDLLLLCDGCNHLGAHHTFCLDPPLAAVPSSQEPWFCPACSERR